MAREARTWRMRWTSTTAALVVLLAVIDLASGQWLFSWGCLGHSGEIWDGKFAVHRDPVGITPQRWSIVRAGVPYQLGSHLTGYFYWDMTQPWNVAAPIWSLIAAVIGLRLGFALLTVCTNRRRRRAGRCGSCGYDLAGLAGRRCPECGSVGPEADALNGAALSCR